MGVPEIKNIFKFYLDIHISDADIMEFVEEHDQDHDSMLDFKEFAQAYINLYPK